MCRGLAYELFTFATTERLRRPTRTEIRIKVWKLAVSLSPVPAAIRLLDPVARPFKIIRQRVISHSKRWWRGRFKSSHRTQSSPAASRLFADVRYSSFPTLARSRPDSLPTYKCIQQETHYVL